MSGFSVIVPAAGKSSRFGDQHSKKPFVTLAERPVWMHSVERFINRSDVKQVLLVIAPEDAAEFKRKFNVSVALMGVEVVIGGAERADSVRNALEKVRDEVEFVAVHDAARPCLADAWIDRVFAAARQYGAAILAAPVAGTLKRVSDKGVIESTVSREGLWEAQTPQVFRRQLLIDAYARHGGGGATDEAQLVEQLGHPVHVVPCSRINMKITTQDDLRLAAQALRAVPKPRILGASHPFEDDDKWR